MARLARAIMIIVGTCAVLLAWGSVPALADPGGTARAYPGSTLHITTSGSYRPKGVVTVTATGTNAPDKYPISNNIYSYGLYLFVVAAKDFHTPCAGDFNDEAAIAGDNPTYATQLNFRVFGEGLSGPFKITTPFTLGDKASGPILICGYSMFGALDDAAWTGHEFSVGGSLIGGLPAPFSGHPAVVVLFVLSYVVAGGIALALARPNAYRWIGAYRRIGR